MNKLYDKIRKYEKRLEDNDIKIVYRYFNPNSTYSRRYDILTDGRVNYINENIMEITNASLVFNVDKKTKVIFVWTEERRNIINKSMIRTLLQFLK